MFRPIILARVFFLALAALCGFWLAHREGNGVNSAILAFLMASMIVLFEYSLRTVSSKHVFLASLGLLYGLLISTLVYETIPETIMTTSTARIVCNFVFGYLGMIIALKHADHLSIGNLRYVFSHGDRVHPRILDTSVIIDGRIEDMISAGFMPGSIMVPTFVIDELQMLADSSDSFKRNKGRRGLTILENMQSETPSLEIVEKDYPDYREVDRKLLEMAKELDGLVVTNDYNLQKVASLHKVPVLNINELADMLKPSVFVGEMLRLQVVREGKETGQGVGYLQDGTMVVIDDGRQHIGNIIEVVVTSILQTNTGRMVFGRPVSDNHVELAE